MQLLKRLESSPAALRATVSSLSRRTDQALTDLDNGVVRLFSRKIAERQLQLLRESILDESSPHTQEDRRSDDDSIVDVQLDQLIADTETMPIDAIEGLDADQLRADLEHDATILTNLETLAGQAVHHDTKRDALVEVLAQIATHPRGPKAVIIASSRATTTDLGRWLRKRIEHDPRLARYRGRTVSVGDPVVPGPKEMIDAIGGFAPLTGGDAKSPWDSARLIDRYDLLIGTDILAEGLNLQQAAFLINYDLPWNPQRLGQRAGRIDRVGSPHDTVTVHTVLPDTGLDLILGLLDRLRRKADVAAATVGIPTKLFPDCPVIPRDFVGVLNQQGHHATRGKPHIADQHRAWLGQALRTPSIAAALESMPTGAGALAATDGYTFCFDRHPDLGPRLCHAATGIRDGATVRDTLACLRQAHTPLTKWIKTVRSGADPLGDMHAVPPEVLADLWKRIDQAREYLTTTIPEQEGGEPTAPMLLTWIAPTNPDNPLKSTGV
ncbi:C-terminal helicase domain-containing protein [Nocardia wallacei]|uniref:C-terminal helicase domain-containing protein n=1 Tax=Nocardia wallacei TaxID=480035 RepID=UPI002456B6BD|nr:C-terminal helicase domain-containing protein [Nocardia wallacei]